MSESLFEVHEIGGPTGSSPLAARMRPRTFDEFIGQQHLTAPEAPFRRAAQVGKLGSVLLWGPPGVGKTTLAEIIARAADASIVKLSATSAGVADLRRISTEAASRRARGGRTLVFIDEIHRFNKSQQDAVLPVVEDGTITLIGATTENPSFEVNSALLSRMRVFVLNPLSDEEVDQVVELALTDERGIKATLDPDARAAVVSLANGDARSSLNLLELAEGCSGGEPITLELVKSVAQRQLIYDKNGEAHFDLISALHKCVRDSDADAAVYWLARMLEGGEDPLYIARRVIRMATEDIGLADPAALNIAVSAHQAAHFIGMPECALALTEAVIYMATVPKSNAVYRAYSAARSDAHNTRTDPVPLHLRNAVTGLMKGLGYGEGYQYAHDFEDAQVEQEHLPPAMRGRTYYEPTDRGWEGRVKSVQKKSST